jgi:uncharacterized membrane protein
MVVRDERKDLDRLRNLSDGVFAIVLTLLTLNLQIPRLGEIRTNTELVNRLVHLSPTLLSYIVTFVVIGMYWMVHTRIIRRIVHPNRRLLSRNLVFLFWLSVVPFTTQLSTGTQDVPLAWALYAANLVMLGLSVVSVWQKAVLLGCVDSHVTPLYGRYIALRGWTVVVVFAASVPLAFVNVTASRLSPVAIPVLAYVVRRRYRPNLVREFARFKEADDDLLPSRRRNEPVPVEDD